MKNFTAAHIVHRTLPYIRVVYPTDLVHALLPWQKRGLQETVSGYGSKLTSEYKLSFENRLYRIYHTCYGNSSSAYIIVRKRRVYIS